ncbi:unnamed protein product [Vitrella brassicaformis CCMP3155]|uniref:Uncharacterized protein n=1 Tax=Vitrella brassicaformis (strain CCMP3155) TaxID=1169540 RepID=A0A0G4EEP9_VITBC|nr:unnamed protein product [Vitrella brassicaformis CCMP3155]|eukprot:CEL93872.1 unnamed protein product [Vitrella brassicaformis CCMP3155]
MANPFEATDAQVKQRPSELETSPRALRPREEYNQMPVVGFQDRHTASPPVPSGGPLAACAPTALVAPDCDAASSVIGSSTALTILQNSSCWAVGVECGRCWSARASASQVLDAAASALCGAASLTQRAASCTRRPVQPPVFVHHPAGNPGVTPVRPAPVVVNAPPAGGANLMPPPPPPAAFGSYPKFPPIPIPSREESQARMKQRPSEAQDRYRQGTFQGPNIPNLTMHMRRSVYRPSQGPPLSLPHDLRLGEGGSGQDKTSEDNTYSSSSNRDLHDDDKVNGGPNDAHTTLH